MIPIDQPKPRKHRAPSRQVAAGVFGGAGAGTLAVWIFSLFGIEVPAHVAAVLGPFVGGLLQYYMKGGRQS